MKKHSLITIIFFSFIFVFQGFGQEEKRFVLENPGKLFQKQQHREAPKLKTRYQFGVGDSSGREYLISQDMYDLDGKIKSTGTFSEDGNKSGDIRYTYDESGKLASHILKHLRADHKEVSYYNSDGQIERTEHFTKADSALYQVKFVYDEKGHLLEEQMFANGELKEKQVYDDTWNSAGRRNQKCHYKMDAAGKRIPQNAEMVMTEYDPDGLILQETRYNNKEKRKMLSWIYYKYQLDNDYKVIKQSGFDEEQKEVYKNELAYTDSSIISTEYKLCDCPAASMDHIGHRELVFNAYGEKIRERIFDQSNTLVSTRNWAYDDFGNQIEFQEVLTAQPEKLIKTKQIFEFRTEQAQTARKSTK
ncbi:MAG: hypothetical protein KDC13_08240 [Bacteroidetes bacterium]|nr:hypothetical protein [Bacteroidota bacterium]